jgi:hypothetical protein
MGSKRTRKGQPFFLHLAGAVILAFMVTGCLHLSGSRQGESHLETARDLLAGEDYQGALEENHKVLENFTPDLRDQALFQIGLIYAHPVNPDRNYLKSLESFQRIVQQFPESPLRQDAKICSLVIGRIIDQQEQIQQLKEMQALLEKGIQKQKNKIDRLQEQLEKLKRIDIRIEEKKREALPQTEEIEGKGDGKNPGS